MFCADNFFHLEIIKLLGRQPDEDYPTYSRLNVILLTYIFSFLGIMDQLAFKINIRLKIKQISKHTFFLLSLFIFFFLNSITQNIHTN